MAKHNKSHLPGEAASSGEAEFRMKLAEAASGMVAHHHGASVYCDCVGCRISTLMDSIAFTMDGIPLEAAEQVLDRLADTVQFRLAEVRRGLLFENDASDLQNAPTTTAVQ